ncbi:MAG TPA: hypothetical protein VE398_20490, partial [Acidobacteriota bacterium]|nr:hypothetical protein [Acidobacteriota bacterium]
GDTHSWIVRNGISGAGAYRPGDWIEAGASSAHGYEARGVRVGFEANRISSRGVAFPSELAGNRELGEWRVENGQRENHCSRSGGD